jgi:hypothetical protein
MTGFEYFSLVFFIFLAQLYKDTPLIPVFTFVFAGVMIFFMIVGK